MTGAPPSSPGTTVELLPCPLCGEKRISLNKPGFNYKKGSINCPACLLTLPGEVNEDELIRCWNDRPSGGVAATPVDTDEFAFAHEGYCNASRKLPVGCDGCSCRAGREIKRLRAALAATPPSERCSECGWNGGGVRDEGCMIGPCPRYQRAIAYLREGSLDMSTTSRLSWKKNVEQFLIPVSRPLHSTPEKLP